MLRSKLGSCSAVYLGFFDHKKFQSKLFNNQPQAGKAKAHDPALKGIS